MAEEFVLQGTRFAIPLPRSLKQEVDGYPTLSMLEELLDNAITATAHLNSPVIKVVLQDLGPNNAEHTLEIEDNGRGMSQEQLQNYIRAGYTTSRLPPVKRDGGVLALRSFFNAQFSRFGLGSNALFKFGNLLEVETYTPHPDKAYKMVADIDEWKEDNQAFQIRLYEKDFGTIDPDEDGSAQTKVIVKKLNPDVLAELQNSSVTAEWARQIRQDYHFFIYGFPEYLWDALPEQLKQGVERPRGGLEINFLGKIISARQQLEDDEQPDLVRVLSGFKEAMATHQGLRPHVTCMRYLPEGMPAPGVMHGMPAAPAAASGSGDDLTDVESRPKSRPVDFIVLWLYFPYMSGCRTKPQANGSTTELYSFPLWSGRELAKSILKTQFPAIHGAADRLAKANSETMMYHFKLGVERVTGLIFISPDCSPTHHKTDVVHDDAYTAFITAGFMTEARKAHTPLDKPRLLTFLWDGIDLTPGSTKKPRAGQAGCASTSAQADAPQRAPDANADGGRWVEDGMYFNGSLAAAQLFEAFKVWHKLDDNGYIVGPVLGTHPVLEELGVLDEDDMPEHGEMYYLGREYEPLRVGELMVVAKDPQRTLQGKKEAAGQQGAGPSMQGGARATGKSHTNERRTPDNCFEVMLFFQTSKRNMAEHSVAARPWRPKWAEQAPVEKKDILFLIPFNSSSQGGEVVSYEVRQKAQKKKVEEWELIAPHGLQVELRRPDGQAGSIPPQFDVSQHWGQVTVKLVSPRNAVGRKAQSAGQPVLLSNFQRWAPDFKPRVEMVIEKLEEQSGAGPRQVTARLVHKVLREPTPNRFEFEFKDKDFAPLQKSPGRYRLTFRVPDNRQGTRLMPPAEEHKCSYDVTVVAGQPSAVQAYFTASANGAKLEGGKQCVARLGLGMLDLVIRLQDSRGRPVPFPKELADKVARAKDPIACPQLTITAHDPAEATRDLRLGISPKHVKLQPGEQGGVGGGYQMVRLDNDALRVRGLFIKPTKLKAADQEGCVSSINVQLHVRLVVSDALTVGTEVSDAPLLKLASGMPYRLSIDSGNWFNATDARDALKLSKGARLDKDTYLRLEDDQGNPFCKDAPYSHGETPPSKLVSPKAELSCDGALSLVLGKQGGAGPHGPLEVSFDSSGDMCKLDGTWIQASGLPGQIGTVQVSLKPLRQNMKHNVAPLVGYFQLRGLVLSASAPWDLDPGQVRQSSASGAAAAVSVEQPGNSEGTRPAKRRRAAHAAAGGGMDVGAAAARVSYVLDLVPLQLPSSRVKHLQAKDPRVDKIIQEGFEVRTRFASSGANMVFIAPNGSSFSTRDAVLAEVNQLLAQASSPTFQQVYVLELGNWRLRGLEVQLAGDEDDTVDEGTEASVKVLICPGPSALDTPPMREVAQSLKVVMGKVRLPELTFGEADFAGDSATASVHVKDMADERYTYGTLYVRLAREARARTVRLAPANIPLLREARVECGGAEGTLQALHVPLVGRGAATGRGLLLQMQQGPAGGSGAASGPLDGGELVARGFSLKAPLRVPAGSTLTVPLVLVDSLGLPMQLPQEQRDQLEASVQASLERADPAARGSAAARARSRQEASGVMQCSVEAWDWSGEALGPEFAASALPVFAVKLRMLQGQGPATLKLRTLHSEQTLRAAAGPSSAGGAAHSQPLALSLALPLDLCHGPLAPDGYSLEVVQPEGLHAQPLPHSEAAAQDGMAAPGCCYAVRVPEVTDLRLRVRLKDAQGCAVVEGGQFELRLNNSAAQPPVLLEVKGGVLDFGLDIGYGKDWLEELRGQPVLAVLAPRSPNFAHDAAQPLHVVLHVTKGSYPRCLEWEVPWMANRVSYRTQLGAAPGVGVDGGHAQGGLPAFSVRLITSDGAKIEGARLQPLLLRYVQVVDGEERADPSQPPLKLPGTHAQQNVYHVAEGQMPLPSTPGTGWMLRAEYRAPDIRNAERVLRCTVAQLEVVGGRACHVALSAETLQAYGRARQTVVVPQDALAQHWLQDVHGQLQDRWGNATTPAGKCSVLLVAQRQIPADNSAARFEQEDGGPFADAVVDASGSFHIPGRFLPADILLPGFDYQLLLEVERAQEEQEQAEGGFEPVLLRTLYVSSQGTGELRRRAQELEAEVQRCQDDLAAAQAQVKRAHQDRDAASGAHQACVRRLDELGMRGGTYTEPQHLADSLRQLAEEARRQRLEDYPWQLQPSARGGRPCCLTPREATRQITYMAEVAAASANDRMLGPALGLGATERDDVAATLKKLGVPEQLFVVVDRQTSKEAEERLDDRLTGQVNFLHLLNLDVFYKYELRDQEVDWNHPQLPLRKSHLVARFRNVLDMSTGVDQGSGRSSQQQQQVLRSNPDGFVGFAVNLVVLPNNLLRFRVNVPADGENRQQNVSATLRQTFWHYIFGDAMVFEHGTDVRAFEQRCHDANIRIGGSKIIALDGKRAINLSGVGQTSRAAGTDTAVRRGPRFCGVPAEFQAGYTPLDMRLRDMQAYAARMQAQAAEVLRVAVEERGRRQALTAAEAALARAEASSAQGEAELGPQLASAQAELAEVQEELERLRQREAGQQQRGGGGAGSRAAGTTGRQFGQSRARTAGGASDRTGAARVAAQVPVGSKRPAEAAGGGTSTRSAGSGATAPTGRQTEEDPAAKRTRLQALLGVQGRR